MQEIDFNLIFDEIIEATKEILGKELPDLINNIPKSLASSLKKECEKAYNEILFHKKEKEKSESEKEKSERDIAILMIKSELLIKIDLIMLDKQQLLKRKLKETGSAVVKAAFSIAIRMFFRMAI